jgi:hypothetical protein
VILSKEGIAMGIRGRRFLTGILICILTAGLAAGPSFGQTSTGGRLRPSVSKPQAPSTAIQVAAPGFEGESLVRDSQATAGQVTAQHMNGFGSQWSSGEQLLWTGAGPGATLTLKFLMAQQGTFAPWIAYTLAPDYGVYAVLVDGAEVGRLDGYAPSVMRQAQALKPINLALGQHVLTLRLQNRNGRSNGDFVGIDRFELHFPSVSAGAVGRAAGAVAQHSVPRTGSLMRNAPTTGTIANGGVINRPVPQPAAATGQGIQTGQQESRTAPRTGSLIGNKPPVENLIGNPMMIAKQGIQKLPAAKTLSSVPIRRTAPAAGSTASNPRGSAVSNLTNSPAKTASRLSLPSTNRPVPAPQGSTAADMTSAPTRTSVSNLTNAPMKAAPNVALPPSGRQVAPPPGRKRAAYTQRERLEKIMARAAAPDPLLAAVVHTIDRGLIGAPGGKTSLDVAFDKALAKHPEVSKQMLAAFVADYKAMPDAARNRAVPASMLNLNATHPMNLQLLKDEFTKVPSISFAALRTAAEGVGQKAPSNVGALLNASLQVQITNVTPAANQGYDPGQSVTLVGRNFSTTKTLNKITLYQKLADGSSGVFGLASPGTSSMTAISTKLPASMTPGAYEVEVTVTGGTTPRTSNRYPVFVRVPPPPPPAISGFNPPGQRPGKQMMIQGTRFATAMPKPMFAAFVPQEGQGIFPSAWGNKVTLPTNETAVVADFKILGDTQGEVTLPGLLSGKYRVALLNLIGQPVTEWAVYDVSPSVYRAEFTQMHCVDESDPENLVGVFSVNDELVASWVVAADETGWLKSSTDYTGFDDGEDDWFNTTDKSVFPVGGGSSEVRRLLAISTTLYEWDAGDAKSANKVIGFIGDLAQDILTGVGQVEAAFIVKLMVPLVQKLVVWLGGDPDSLGTQNLAWTGQQLINFTGAAAKFGGKLNFNNDDDTGSYWLKYQVLRVE